MKKENIITLIIILVIIIFGIYSMFKTNGNVDEETAKCIASKSTLYVAKGCVACKTQEKIFGENFAYMNAIDCAITPEKCSPILENGFISVPTWIINNEKIRGVQSMEKLKNLTGC